jgi:hypothetical protein
MRKVLERGIGVFMSRCKRVIGEGNWCFYESMQEGYPMVKEAAAFLKRPNFGSALFLYNCY